MEHTVLSQGDITTFRMDDLPKWDERRLNPEPHTLVAGLDPAYTTGGDNCPLQVAEIGVFEGGRLGMWFWEPYYIKIDASATRPAVYQVSDQAIAYCMANSIPLGNLMIDSSGTQQVGAIVAVESGIRPMECNYANKASEESNKRFANVVTEMWFMMADLGRSGQIRGLSDKAAEQFCKRRFKKGTTPLSLESKADYKQRTGLTSPDEGDAAAQCCLAARKVAGLTPGADRPANTPNFSLGFQLPASMGKTLKTSYKPLDFSRLSAYTTG